MGEHRLRLRSLLGVGSTLVALGAPLVPTPVVSVPVGDIVAPAVALGVIRRILRTRADQAMKREHPRTLTVEEMGVLGEVARLAEHADENALTPDVERLPPEVTSLLSSVESTEAPHPNPGRGDWTIVVRLLGEPIAESRAGSTAVFGKKRSIELLAWMVLNRDRLSRSAARNAMWDIPVADSTFGTILSDLRRGLARLAPPPTPEGWCPATFTDRLVLPEGIVSDTDLLDMAVMQGGKDDLVRELSRIRDVPFAGASYVWADLDGSTTRSIISVLDAVDRLVKLGSDEGDTRAMMVALRAGLRVMPGDETLMALQNSLLIR